MKRLLLAALVAVAPFSVYAQTQTTYTGTVKDLTQATVTSGRITFTLNAPSGANIPGTGSFVSSRVSCLISASGHPVASSDGISACVITNNTALTPTGTSYTMCTQPYNVTPGSCIVTYATGGTVDISTIVPTPATQPSYGVASLTNANTWSGPQTWTGLQTFPMVNMNGLIQWTAPGPAIKDVVASNVRTFLNPEIYSAVTDTSPLTHSAAQGDGTETPILHIESFNQSPNDASPIYFSHTCSYTGGSTSTNGACVGGMFAVTNTPTSKLYGLEAVNAIVNYNSTDPTVQVQGIELNQFNNSGNDCNVLANGAFNNGPCFGISATAGGPNAMVAAFNVQDQAVMTPGAGWHRGFWSERALDAHFAAGIPNGINGAVPALQAETQGVATPSANADSMPIALFSSYSDGSTSHPFETTLRAYTPSGHTGQTCMAIGFTTAATAWYTCNDGSMFVGGPAVLNSGAAINGGILTVNYAGNAGLQVGYTASATSPYLDFASSGFNNQYDSRIVGIGGTNATNGAGAMQFVAGAGFTFTGPVNLPVLAPGSGTDCLQIDHATGAVTNTGSPCGTGSPGVGSIDTLTGAFTFSGAGVSHIGNAYTFSGVGSGVTSVALTTPAWLTVGGSPVTSSGTLAVTATGGQTQNQVLATPNGSSGAVGLRALVNADLPAALTPTSVAATTSVSAPTFYTNAEFSLGTCTTAKTVDPVNGNKQKVTLTNANTCALTFTQPGSGTATVQLKITQSAAGSFNGLISGCKWPGGAGGGVAPVITASSGALDMVQVYLDGTTAFCQIAQAFN